MYDDFLCRAALGWGFGEGRVLKVDVDMDMDMDMDIDVKSVGGCARGVFAGCSLNVLLVVLASLVHGCWKR